ncbi:MAG: hypothetical protein U0610_06300 [bacterium]
MQPHRRRFALVISAAVLVLQPVPARAHGVPPRFAAVMAEIGTRFASLATALTAKNDDLARYQVRQIAELFERDLALATPPRPLYGMDLEPLRRAFLEGPLAALRDAVEAHDGAAAARTFQAAATACNDCHRTTGVAFWVVPGLSPPARTTKSKVSTSPAR